MKTALRELMDYLITLDAAGVSLVPYIAAVILTDDLEPVEIEILGNLILELGQTLVTIASIVNAQQEKLAAAKEAEKKPTEPAETKAQPAQTKPATAAQAGQETKIGEEQAETENEKEYLVRQIRQLQAEQRQLRECLQQLLAERTVRQG